MTRAQRLHMLLATLAVFLGLATPLSQPAAAGEGWLRLFDGHSLFGWQSDASPVVKDGILLIGGETPASLRTRMPFSRFVLRVSYAVTGNGELVLGDQRLPLPERQELGVIEVVYDRGATATPIAFVTPKGGELRLAEINLKPLGLQPAAWAGVQGSNAVALHGPQALAATQSWNNFVFQVEVRMNEKDAQGGVAFRTSPRGSGYRVALRNQWVGDDRTRPIGYGTGGLDGFARARRIVPNAGEWFTLTILAQGNHFAVWVNGELVTDFVDQRPLAADVRQGRVEQAGVMELQADRGAIHFRNGRIAPPPR
jgi:hypothetical protein